MGNANADVVELERGRRRRRCDLMVYVGRTWTRAKELALDGIEAGRAHRVEPTQEYPLVALAYDIQGRGVVRKARTGQVLSGVQLLGASTGTWNQL